MKINISMNINIIYPKRAGEVLKNKVQKAIIKINNGVLMPRKSGKKGFKTYSLGRYERIVMVGNKCFCFAKHSDYEFFIDKYAGS